MQKNEPITLPVAQIMLKQLEQRSTKRSAKFPAHIDPAELTRATINRLDARFS